MSRDTLPEKPRDEWIEAMAQAAHDNRWQGHQNWRWDTANDATREHYRGNQRAAYTALRRAMMENRDG